MQMIYPDDGGTPIIRNIRSPTPHCTACSLLAPELLDGLELYLHLPLVFAYECHGVTFTLHGIITQTTKNFILTAVRTSDVSYYNLALLEFVYLHIMP
jgi:hypothetical protein